MWFAATDTPDNPAQIVKTPGKLQQRLQRFLQVHDQQTAGVPGLNIVYEGMQARVTEKLVKHKNIVILKHSPCTVVGWDLHPADRQRKDGPERFLDYLPLCIFLHFKDATWVVDERLGPGVWPLYQVERTWTLNESLGTKIRRKGFTLLPDYASTAFMIQGATLPAGIADCGDIADYGGLSELMTTYVILSRVKSANGLLLLRAFCPNMFQMGALPAPHCLLKLLRHRFGTEAGTSHAVAGAAQGSAGHAAASAATAKRHADASQSLPVASEDIPGAAQSSATPATPTARTAGSQLGVATGSTARQAYGAAEATAEYKERMAACDVWRAQRKQPGPDWP